MVALVVHGVENTENIDAHLGSLLHKSIDQVVGVVPVTDQVLSPQ